MYKVGLTGSIGSGKSSVSNIIRSQGITVLDADEISRHLTRNGSPITDELVDAFGTEIINGDNELDRKKLAVIAFSSKEGTDKLSNIVTLKVKSIMNERMEKLGAIGEKLVFFDVPLLFEYQMDREMDEVWTVAADDEIRLLRVEQRDGLSEEEFWGRDSKQMLQALKIDQSDVVIYNNLGKEELEDTVLDELTELKLRMESSVE